MTELPVDYVPGTVYAPVVEALKRRLQAGFMHEAVSASTIVRADESTGLLQLEPQQRIVLDAAAAHRFVYVTKYRQAKISTPLALGLLAHVEYTPGIQGLLIANATGTANVLWQRANFAYDKQHAAVQIPLEPGTRAGERKIVFAHKGTVRAITGGGESPAIGNSPDRVLITEYPDLPDQGLFNRHFFPTVNTRPHARVVMEATPGLYQSEAHQMWTKALEGRGRFHPVFLPWYEDLSIRPIGESGEDIDCSDLIPTQEELRIIEECPGITYRHLAFRRLALDTEFGGDARLFEHKYPSNAYGGWITETAPKLPEDALAWYAQRAAARNIAGDSVEVEYEPPEEEENCPYLMVIDSAGWGEGGDPSAITIFQEWDMREVWSWSGREDPELVAKRARRVQEYYGVARTRIVPESNKGEVISALRAMGVYVWENPKTPGKPGWFASEQSNQEGLTALVEMLRSRTIDIRTKATIHQLMQWDGKGRTRRGRSAEGLHHFDRAVTCRIAAWVRRYAPNGTVRPPPVVQEGPVRWTDQRRAHAVQRAKVLGIRVGY